MSVAYQQADYWNPTDSREVVPRDLDIADTISDAPLASDVRRMRQRTVLSRLRAMLAHEGESLPRVMRRDLRAFCIAGSYRPEMIGWSTDRETEDTDFWVSDPEDWRSELACVTLPKRRTPPLF